MNKKDIKFSGNARAKLQSGVDLIANSVKITLGPAGRNVVIGKTFGSPHITKDGVTVAKAVESNDPEENLGVQLVREVASKTNDIAGDGTTTATVLAQSIVTQGLQKVTNGSNPIDLKRGIDKATTEVLDKLSDLSKPVKTKAEKEQIATISANNEPSIGNLIADAIEQVGNDGVITVEEAKGTETEVNIVDGMQIDRGYLSPFFMTNQEKQTAELTDPNGVKILLVDGNITNMNKIIGILEPVFQTDQPLLIIADDVDQTVIGTLVVNKGRQGMRVCAIKSPGFGEKRSEMLEDIAILTGGTVISEKKGIKLENATKDMLGTCMSITVNKDKTIITDGAGTSDEITDRINLIKSQIESSDSNYDQEALQTRLAKLSGGVAVIKIGAATEVEMKEKKDRVDDALSATRAAIEEGIVEGGGMALFNISNTLSETKFDNLDQELGYNIIKSSLLSPITQIIKNAGVEPINILIKLQDSQNSGKGYNARTHKIEDLMKSGVIDPVKVTKQALLNASSIAGLLLTTECTIVDRPEENINNPQQM